MLLGTERTNSTNRAFTGMVLPLKDTKLWSKFHHVFTLEIKRFSSILVLDGRKLHVTGKQPAPYKFLFILSKSINHKECCMKKLLLVVMLIVAVVVSQSMIAQDKPVEKKVEKVVKSKKNTSKEGKEKKECSEKMDCCKDKKCCDKCTGDKCDGKCCAKCAECKKVCAAKCEMEKKGKCAMDSTKQCEKKDMKKPMHKKTVIKKEVKEGTK
jgi:hypothetical protein